MSIADDPAEYDLHLALRRGRRMADRAARDFRPRTHVGRARLCSARAHLRAIAAQIAIEAQTAMQDHLDQVAKLYWQVKSASGRWLNIRAPKMRRRVAASRLATAPSAQSSRPAAWRQADAGAPRRSTGGRRPARHPFAWHAARARLCRQAHERRRRSARPPGDRERAMARRSSSMRDNAMGQIAADFAMTAAIDTARTTHVAIAAVRNSNHCGAMDHWAAMALPHDMIGIATTNALPTMAPWGGIDKIVGINPLAVAIPAGERAADRARHRLRRDRAWQDPRLPSERPSDSRKAGPSTQRASRRPMPPRRMDGLIQPIGGHKGVGLGIVMGMLSTLLSGASYGTELGNMIDGPKAGTGRPPSSRRSTSPPSSRSRTSSSASTRSAGRSKQPAPRRRRPALSAGPARSRVRTPLCGRGHSSER